MSRTYVQPGKVLNHTAGADIEAGDVVVIGDIVGVAQVDIANGGTGAVAIEGVHRLRKVAGAAWGQGDKLHWDASAASGAGAFAASITPATGDVSNCAIAAASAGSDDTVGEVRLTPGTGSGS